ncbi:unnamed protein product [Rodentolepis nana]|uniref:KH_dom_type_1 domain-containing protein n=1 Tax=Rodentolepis nana TaxID=102285 RepID=A0A0R3TFK9_RODNA|nr:unnamed protein product [Rodentolepis nana]
MECSGRIYNATGESEDVRISVPINGTSIASSEMVSSIAILQRQINRLLTDKIEPNAPVVGNSDKECVPVLDFDEEQSTEFGE